MNDNEIHDEPGPTRPETLPGLEWDASPAGSGALLAAARATIAAVDEEGLLTARHTLTCQQILALAAAVDRGLSFGKVSIATVTLSRQLQDLVDQLPTPSAETNAAFEQLVEALASIGETGRPLALVR